MEKTIRNKEYIKKYIKSQIVKMEVLSVVCLVMLFLCGMLNIFVEGYRLVKKLTKYHRLEQLRAQVQANRFRHLNTSSQHFRVRVNHRRSNPPRYAGGFV